MPTSQLGGKGTMRRKKKVVGKNNFAPRKCKQQLDCESCIKRVNNYLKNIEDEYLQLVNSCIEDIGSNQLEQLEKFDVKNKNVYKNIKKDCVEYFNNNFIIQQPYSIKNRFHIYFIKKICEVDAESFIVEMFNLMENNLEREDYKKDLDKEEKEMSTEECYKLLGIDFTDEITKEQLKKAYRKKSFENHPDKHIEETEKYEKIFADISVAYKNIIKKIFN